MLITLPGSMCEYLSLFTHIHRVLSLCYKHHPFVAAAELQQISVHCGINKKFNGYLTRGVV